MSSAESGAAVPQRVVVLHPAAPRVLDRLLELPTGEEPATWPDLLAAATGVLPDGALPMRPAVHADGGDLYVTVARTGRRADGARWVEVPPGDWPGGVRSAVACALDEDAGRAPAPPNRPSWARRGWWDDVTAWVEAALAEGGHRMRAGSPEPVQHWSISAVARVPYEGPEGARVAWLKAVGPHFVREVRLLPALHAALDGAGPVAGERLPRLPTVLAVRDDGPAGGLLLLADAGTVPDDVAPAEPADLAAALARLQVATVRHLPRLAAEGSLDDRTPDALADALDRLLDDGPETGALDPGERTAWRAALPRVRARLHALDAGPLPRVLLHGDFHPWNVVRAPGWRPGEEVVLDWTDAAVGIAGADLVTLLPFGADDAQVAAVVDAYGAVWSAVLDLDPAAVRAQLRDVLPVGRLVQAVAFDGILRTVEPAHRFHNAGAVVPNLRAAGLPWMISGGDPAAPRRMP